MEAIAVTALAMIFFDSMIKIINISAEKYKKSKNKRKKIILS